MTMIDLVQNFLEDLTKQYTLYAKERKLMADPGSEHHAVNQALYTGILRAINIDKEVVAGWLPLAKAQDAKVAELEATIQAWELAFGTIRAHLQDRINMGDAADPKRYLEIIESDIGQLPVTAQQIQSAHIQHELDARTQIEAQRVEIRNLKKRTSGSKSKFIPGRGHTTLSMGMATPEASEMLKDTSEELESTGYKELKGTDK